MRFRFMRRRRRFRVRFERQISHPQDILGNIPIAATVFWLPIFAIAVTGYSHVALDIRTGVWTGACLMMALGSLINAMRCGRLQCYWLTPLFLVGALASVGYGTGVLPLGQPGWGIIGYTLLSGVVVISSLPELFLGRYR